MTENDTPAPRWLTIDLANGDWVDTSMLTTANRHPVITSEEAHRVASSVLPGTTPEQVGEWYGAWMSDDPAPAPQGALASAGHEPTHRGVRDGHHMVECSCGWDNSVDLVVGVMGRPATWPEHLDAEGFTGQVVLHAGTPSELRDALYALEAESMHVRIPEWIEAYPDTSQALAYAQGFSAALEVLPAIHNGRAVHVGRVTVQGRAA